MSFENFVSFVPEIVGKLPLSSNIPSEVSISECYNFICRVWGRRTDIDRDMVPLQSSLDMRIMVGQLYPTIALLNPIHIHMVNTNRVNESYFKELLNTMDLVYGETFESPKESIIALRDIIISLNITLNNVSPNSEEIESILLYGPNEWQMYKFLVETNFLSMENLPTDEKAGIYQDGERLIAAVSPFKVKSFINNEANAYVADLYNVLRLPYTLDNKLDKENNIDLAIESLRVAMTSTIPTREGAKVERGADADIMLKVNITPQYANNGVHGVCRNCEVREINIYSPICKHFVSCDHCIIERPEVYCPYCFVDVCKNKIVFKVELNGVQLDRDIDSAAICNAIAPGVVFDNVLHRKINETPRNTKNLRDVAKYISRITDMPLDIALQRAAQYIYVNHSLYDKVTTLWYVKDSSIENVILSGGVVTLEPYNEYISSHPNHSFEEIVNLHHVHKIFKGSEECVSCMDECELLVMSKCGHQAICGDCIKMTGSRCPVCRSENNVALRIA